jgi:hypothetical protein
MCGVEKDVISNTINVAVFYTTAITIFTICDAIVGAIGESATAVFTPSITRRCHADLIVKAVVSDAKTTLVVDSLQTASLDA